LDRGFSLIWLNCGNYQYQYQYANQPVRQLFGKTLNNIIGQSNKAFFDEATAANLREYDRRVIALGERLTFVPIRSG